MSHQKIMDDKDFHRKDKQKFKTLRIVTRIYELHIENCTAPKPDKCPGHAALLSTMNTERAKPKYGQLNPIAGPPVRKKRKLK